MSKILLIILLTLSAVADTFIVQNNSSSIEFSVKKFFFLNIEGRFTKFKGKITLDDNHMIASINGLVDAASADMGDAKREVDLKEEAYLNSLKYPYIEFKAISTDDEELEATISIKGIVQKVKFNIDKMELVNSKLILTISAILHRDAF
ncbi:MAG: polyisoprenoid-binding protein, partial [Sulfurimonas sp.]